MAAWTATERLALIDLLTEELDTRNGTTLYDYKWYTQSVRGLTRGTRAFLEDNRRQFASVIARYNREKPDEEPEI